MKETKFKQTEVGMIPSDWEVACLGDLGSFKNGISKPAEKFGHGFPFVNLMDIFEKTSIKGNEEFGLIESVSSEQQMYSLRRGDVLFVRSSVKPEGVGLTTVVKKDLSKTVFSGFILRFRELGERLNTDYKEFVFYSDYFRRNLIASSTVSANTNINQPALKKLIIAFPKSIEEQQRIANALSDVDTLINNLEKLIAKKKNIKQGAMQQLLTGKKRLPGFGSDERTGSRPTDERRKECHSERSAKREVEESSGYKMTELGLIPNDWEVKTISQVGKIIGGGTPSTFNSAYWNGSVQWFTPAELSKAGKYVSKSERTITKLGVENCSAKILPAGTILLTTRASIGTSAILKAPACTNQGFQSLVVNSENSNEFLYYLLSTKVDEMMSLASGSTFLEISPKKLGGIQLQIPSSRAEQTAIANVLSDMDTEIATLETKLAKYRKLKTGMMQQLLTGKIRLV